MLRRSVLTLNSAGMRSVAGGLASYHCGLVCNNQTTNEDLKHTWDGTTNPHDKGCCANFRQIMCRGPRPSYMCDADREASVMEQGATSELEEGESKSELIQTPAVHVPTQ